MPPGSEKRCSLTAAMSSVSSELKAQKTPAYGMAARSVVEESCRWVRSRSASSLTWLGLGLGLGLGLELQPGTE